VKTENIEVNTDCKLTCDFEILRRSSVFAGADIEVIKLFAYLAGRKKYKPGNGIITMGTEAAESFYLISGTAEATTMHRNKEVALQQIHAGTFFGELSLLARFKWFFNVRPLTECEVIIITRESFRKVLEKYPEKRDKMVEKIIQLRVERLVEQTTFILDKLPDSLMLESGESTSNFPI